MVAANQQTIAKQLYEAINELVYKYKYFTPDNLEVRRLLAAVQKLMDPEPAKAHLAKSMLMGLIGEFEHAINHVKISNTGLPLDNPDLHLNNSATALANCNIYSESHIYYQQIKNVSLVDPFFFLNAGLNCLALNKLKELIMDAIKFGIKLDESKMSLALRAAKVLESANISDSIVAQYADVFGDVLRENRFFNADLHPQIIIGDDENNWHPHTVFVTFKVKTDAATAADLYKKSVIRSIQKYGSMPDALHLSIEAI